MRCVLRYAMCHHFDVKDIDVYLDVDINVGVDISLFIDFSCFAALYVLWYFLLCGFPSVPSLSLAFPCFLFPALAFFSFICKEFGDDMFPIYW